MDFFFFSNSEKTNSRKRSALSKKKQGDRNGWCVDGGQVFGCVERPFISKTGHKGRELDLVIPG